MKNSLIATLFLLFFLKLYQGSLQLTEITKIKAEAARYLRDIKVKKSRKLLPIQENTHSSLLPKLLDHALKGKALNQRKLAAKKIDNDLKFPDISEIEEFSKNSLKNELNLFKTEFKILNKKRILEEKEFENENQIYDLKVFEKEIKNKVLVEEKHFERELRDNNLENTRKKGRKGRKMKQKIRKVKKNKPKKANKRYSKDFILRHSLRNLF